MPARYQVKNHIGNFAIPPESYDFPVDSVFKADPKINYEPARKLLALNQPGGPEFMETFFAFIENGFRHKETAASMWIHIRTLQYRLDKVENATGIYFRKDPQLAIRLYLTTKSLQNFIKVG